MNNPENEIFPYEKKKGKSTPKSTSKPTRKPPTPGPSGKTKRTFITLPDTITSESGKAIDIAQYKKGTYTGSTPMQAASKAFTKICRTLFSSEECECIFSVQETTKDSKGRIFTYKGIRSKLKEPKVMQRGNSKPYEILYENKIKAYKK